MGAPVARRNARPRCAAVFHQAAGQRGPQSGAELIGRSLPPFMQQYRGHPVSAAFVQPGLYGRGVGADVPQVRHFVRHEARCLVTQLGVRLRGGRGEVEADHLPSRYVAVEDGTIRVGRARGDQ